MEEKDSGGAEQSAAPRRRPGELEAQLVAVLVEVGRPLTPGEVLEALGEDVELSYSTVVTILTRLYRKGTLTRRRHGRAYRYRPSVDAAALSADRMTRILVEDANRESVLRRFVSALDPRDEEILRKLLRPSGDPED